MAFSPRSAPPLAANASIWPIQLLDARPRIPVAGKRLDLIALDRIEFEDVSFYFDFDLLASLVAEIHDGLDLDSYAADGALGASPAEGANGGGSGDDDRQTRIQSRDHGNFVKGKQKRIPDEAALGSGYRPSKSIKLEASTSSTTVLVDTACVFWIEARAPQHADTIASLLQHLRSRCRTSLRLGTVRLGVDEIEQRDQSIFGHVATLWLSSQMDDVLATLPLINTYGLEASMRPDQMTNSNWIAAAERLTRLGETELVTSVDIVEPPQGVRPRNGDAEPLCIKLSIRVSVALKPGVSAGTMRPSVVEDLAELVRFADCNGSEQDEADRRKKVNAKFVMDHLRSAEIEASDYIQPPDLNPTLLPFQKRSTAFLLGREGKAIGADGELYDTPEVATCSGASEVGLWWKKLGEDLYYHFLEGRFVDRAEATLQSNTRGAMLAEEMGLGKTVEVLALILLNPRTGASSEASFFDVDNDIEVHPTKTTLIVAPETLRQQWLDEIARHAPELRVYSYVSRSQAEKDTPEDQTWIRWAAGIDVIVTSYRVLTSELNTAKKEPPRSRRHPRKYERPRSPLIRLQFHRVVMDEVQMVGNSHAAETAALIHRGSSLAVSGTPVKKIDDIKACFRFLRLPCCETLDSPSAWSKVLSPLLAPVLISVLRIVGARHTKAMVAHDMSLPPQTCSVVPIDFTAIEAAFYADVWRDALNAVQIDADGTPLVPDWEFDLTTLLRHLLLLRQACTHPQVAVHRRGAVVGNHNLRSIDEVLELMIDGTKSELQSARGHSYDKRILKAILTLYYRDPGRHVVVEAQMLDLQRELRQEVAQLEQDLKEAQALGPLYKFSDHELQLEQKEDSRRAAHGPGHVHLPSEDELEAVAANGGSEEWQKLMADPDYREKRRQRSANLGRISLVLRLAYLRLHRVLQFTGNLYFQRGEFLDEQLDADPAAAVAAASAATAVAIEAQAVAGAEGGPQEPEQVATVKVEDEAAPVAKVEPVDGDIGKDSAATMESDPRDALDPNPEVAPLTLRQQLKRKEDEAYQAAEELRQRLLTEHRSSVEQGVRKLEATKVDFGKTAMLLGDETPFDDGGGIATHDAYCELAEICRLLDRHAEVLFAWRDGIIERLKRPVNRDINFERDDDDQYQENLDTQAEAEALLEMYRPLIAEREVILSGAVAIGATAKPQLYAELEAAIRSARRRQLLAQSSRGAEGDDDDGDDNGDDEDEPNDEVLRVQKQQLEHFKWLDKERRSVSLPHPSGSMTAIRGRLKEVIDGDYPEAEIELAQRAVAESRKVSTAQNRLLAKIKAEAQSLLAPLFNARSTYFKEMQMLSDSVSDPAFGNLDTAIRAAATEEASHRAKAEGLESRLRYLTHLGTVQRMEAGDAEARWCYICTEEFATGVLTNACGHVCCERCFHAWQGQGHRSCPMCKTRVLPNEVHRILYTDVSHTAAHDDAVSKHPVTASSASSSSSSSTAANVATAPIKFSLIPPSYRARIDEVGVQGRYGSKIDFVCKHIAYLFLERGEKSIVFSSFSRGLDVISQSLRANGLRYLRLESGGGKDASRAATRFHQPEMAAMLLHSEAQSAGLNLLCAQHVHILEPFLERSKELQAVGRVHRIGQTKPTNVWVYQVKGTVEERILQAAAKRGESLYAIGPPTTAVTGQGRMSKMAGPQQRQNHNRNPKHNVNLSRGAKGDWAMDRTETIEVFCQPLARRLASAPASASGRVAGDGDEQ
ncbi:hypothetical protein ACQY0O_001389 [Thecaphora frezii]